MSKVKIQGNASGSGVFTLTSPNSSTDRTITLPDGTGTLAFTTGDDDKLPLAGGTLTGDLILGDNVKLEVGSASGGDLQIYHDGSNSYIDDAGTGSLKIRSGTLTISNAGGNKTSALFSSGGAQTLYHNNNVKFVTSNTGITVTGTVDVNGAYSLPTSDGSANQVLTTDGSGGVTFATPSVSAGGSNTHVQYNDEGVLGGSSTFTYDEAEAKLTVGGTVSSILFETVSDYGAITTTATDSIDYGTLTESVVALVNSDYGVVETSGGPVEFPQYTVSGVPDASAYTGHMVYVSNETGGPVMAFSDGTNWRRITDRTVIS
jgi:hypothetical protein